AAEALATAAHTQALTQLTHQLDLQATAQERLAEAAGQGEAAMRQAAIDNEVAAADARSAAEGTATRTALMRQEAAVVKQIRDETTSDIRQAIEANKALTRAVAEGPEAVREAELAIRAHALALREATEGTDEFKAAYAHYIDLLRDADQAEQQYQQAQARRDQLMQPFKDALRGIEGAFTTAFENIFSGNRKGFADFADTIKGIFARLAAELVTMLVFQPVVGAVLQTAGVGGSTLASLGLPGGGGGFGASGLGSAGLTKLGGSFATSSVGQALGLSKSAVGVIPEAVAGDVMLTGAGNAFIGALPGAGGALAGGLVGYQSGSPIMGGLSGGIAAAALGAGPIGIGIAAIAGVAGGLIGKSAQRRAERDRKEVERQQRIAQLVPAMEQFYALAGEPMTGVSKMLADLTRQFQQLSSQAKELGLDTDLLADSFDKARQRIKDDFAKGIEDAILAFENDAELAFQNLEEAHRQRIREAIDAEADLDRVRHLNALELKRFFEGLSAEQIEGLGQAVHLADLLEAKLRELGQSAAKEIDAQIQLSASAESTARQAAEAFRNLARTLQEAVHQLRTGNLSTLSARDRLAEQRGQFDQTASAALAGDQAAMQRLPQLGQQLLEASMAYNGSTTAYATDFDRVMQVLRDAGVVAGGEAGRQQTQADVLHIQAELLRKIRDELANPEGPNAEILRGQLQTLGIIDGVLKGQSTVSVEQLSQLAGVSAGERTIAEQIAAGNSKIASLLEDFLQVQQQERLERQRKEAEEAARQARQAQIDARAATARGAAANLAGQIGGVRAAGATGNQELAVQMFKTMTGAVTGTASDRGSAQFDRADQLRVILSGFAQQLTAITGGTLPTDAAVFASTKYGSGYRIGSVNKAQSFGINDYVSIVSSFVRDAALQLAGITPELRDAISQISWTNLPAAFDQLQRAVLDIRGFAAGTSSASPGWAWVGEKGPELIRLRGGEEILPHDVSMRVTQAVPLPPLPRAAAAANDRGVETRLEAIAAELKALRSEQERLMNAQIATAAEGARRVENAVEDNTAETRKVERAIDRQTQASLVA
ncbi:MAG TPA: hypothetical protein VGO20_20445, partial [Arenibaculum sp.]|nr:hypothetical protein [Arenibaculum sp.]